MKEHMSSNQEDYLESIYKILLEQRVVRVKDISQDLGVSNPSVSSALRSLAKDGLIDYEPYGIITLTDRGLQRARRIYQRHLILLQFFQNIFGISKEEAEAQACIMEHGMSRLIFKRLVQLMKYLHASECMGADWIDHFAEYCSQNDLDMDDVDAVYDFLAGIADVTDR